MGLIRLEIWKGRFQKQASKSGLRSGLSSGWSFIGDFTVLLNWICINVFN